MILKDTTIVKYRSIESRIPVKVRIFWIISRCWIHYHLVVRTDAIREFTVFHFIIHNDVFGGVIMTAPVKAIRARIAIYIMVDRLGEIPSEYYLIIILHEKILIIGI